METLFPEYELTLTKRKKGCEVLIKSYIHLHLDIGASVEVYLYPVESLVIIPHRYFHNLVKDVIRHHLRECYVLAKYHPLTFEDMGNVKLVTKLFKGDPDFLYKLHNLYP